MDWSNGRLIERLQSKFPNLSLAIFKDPGKKDHYNFELNHTKVFSLPFPMTHYRGVINSIQIYRQLKFIADENDLLIIQLPFIAPIPLLFLKKPVVYHVCANVLTAANNPIKYQGIHRLLARSYAFFLHLIHKSLFAKKRNKTIVNGKELGSLYSKYQPLVAVSSSLRNHEVILEDQIPCKNELPFKFLYIGRPSLEKGFDLTVQALDKLRLVYPIQLQVLGFSQSDFIKLLPQVADSIIDMQWITFKDFISFGEEFKSICMVSHALLLPSRSEGTPRVLLEARAFGCPVIASNVGGIPSSVTHGVDGLLFNSGSLKELCEALERFMNDSNLRRSLSRQGLKTAKKYSLEYFSDQFENLIESYHEA